MKKLSKQELFDALTEGDAIGKNADGTFRGTWEKYYRTEARQEMGYEFKDGSVLVFPYPKIESTMAYNDEYDAPSTSYESWRDYNMRYLPDFGIEKWLECKRDLERYGVCSGVYGQMWFARLEDGSRLVALRYGEMECCCGEKPEDKPFFVRYLNDTEQKDVVSAYLQYVERYEKRLATYYKRYGDKISTCGYWANR